MIWILFYLLAVFLDLYSFQSFKTIFKGKTSRSLYFIVSWLVLIYFSFSYIILKNESNGSLPLGLLIAFYTPKFILIIFNLIEDLFRVIVFIYRVIFKKNNSVNLIQRRKFISKFSLGLASIPFLSLNLGMIWGKHNFKVLSYDLFFEDLPPSFHNFTITQISDLHAGNITNLKKLEHAVNLINSLDSNIIVFTGDLVNNNADELIPFLKTLSKLKANDGKFSILGNHDYGDYKQWPTEKMKRDNFDRIKKYQKEIGFELLLNEHKYLEKDGDKLAIIGVENWGNGFIKKGDLNKASSKINPKKFKILLTHDPTHWEKVALKQKTNYNLTLSGHTHGGQFGIEIPGFIKWSPVQWRYKYWAGIYKVNNQILNVNRGLGTTAVPGRVGVWPEISVITLKRSNNI